MDSKEMQEHEKHTENVFSTCQRLGCTPWELLQKDYAKELETSHEGEETNAR